MTVDQRGHRRVREAWAFAPRRCCASSGDRDGNKHDIVVLGHNVAQVQAQLEAYGLPEAVQR